MHRARLTRQAQNSHPSCRGRRPRRPVNSIKNAAAGGIFTLSRGAERPNCDRPRSGHLSGRTRAPKASGRGGRGRNVGASVPAQKRFSLGLHPVSLGKTKEMGWKQQHNLKSSRTKRRVPPTPRAGKRKGRRERLLPPRGVYSLVSPSGPLPGSVSGFGSSASMAGGFAGSSKV